MKKFINKIKNMKQLLKRNEKAINLFASIVTLGSIVLTLIVWILKSTVYFFN